MAIKTRPDSGLRTRPKHPTRTIHKNCMIPCCRKLGLEIHAHRHGHACPPAWPPGGQFFAKKMEPENGPKNASIFWPRFGAHEQKTVLQQRVGPKLRPFSGPQNGPAKMTQNWFQIWSKTGAKMVPSRTEGRVPDPLHIQLSRASGINTLPNAWKAQEERPCHHEGCDELP